MSDESERESPQMKSVEEIEQALRLYQGDTTAPDRIANAERRRTLLWVLNREDEAEEIEYENDVLPHSFR